MKPRRTLLTLIIAILAGLSGGWSASFFMGRPAFGEKNLTHERVIRAEAFELIGEDGRTYGSISLSNKGPVFTMRDWDGAVVKIWTGRLEGESTAGISLTSPKNEAIRLTVSDLDTMIYSSKGNSK